MPGPKIHEKYGPSSSDRWIPCPFSLTIDCPRLPTAASLLGDEAHDYGAEILVSPGKDIHVPSHLRVGVRMYTDHVQANDAVPMVERKWMSMEVEEHGGTIDALLIKDRVAVLYDYKNGRWPVQGKSNSQLLCYAGLANEHFEIDVFHGFIIQPNAFKGSKIKAETYTPQQVADHRLKVIDAVENPDRKCTGDWCRWCNLRLTAKCEEGLRYGRAKGW